MQSFQISIIPNRRGESLYVFSFTTHLKNTAQKSLVRGKKGDAESCVVQERQVLIMSLYLNPMC